MKVFLVNDTDGEGCAFYAASTHKKAWMYIKTSQLNSILAYKSRGWTDKQLEGMKQHYDDPEELHPYDIQEIEVDEKY